MIAIHNSSYGFHPRWISYCENKEIPYKLVNCFGNDLIEQLKGCKALMWHFNQSSHRDNIIAKQIIFALEHSGLKLYPNIFTSWHFDDKVAQKYLLEAIGAPLVTSFVFFDKKEALTWAQSTTYPKVFKLRGGAGSQNVRLIRTESDCKKLINKAFKKGFPKYDSFESLKERIYKFRQGKMPFFEIIKGIVRLFYPPPYARLGSNEVGYIYFQEFIPDLDCDYRVIVVDDKALTIKRFVRDNDFRASGSGKLAYDQSLFSKEMLKLAFDLSKKLGLQTVAFDFIVKNQEVLLVELSYGFPMENFSDNCPGFWDRDLNWNKGKYNHQGWIVDLILKEEQKWE